MSQGAGRDEGETAARGGGGRVGGAVALRQVWRPVWRQAGRRAATGGDEWGRQAKVASSALIHVPLKTTILILPREVYQHGGPSGASTRPRRIG